MSHFTPPRRTPSFGFLALAMTSALLWATGARAADLDPGYTDVPPPIPQQVVSFGSGWYVRGDIGVTDKDRLDVDKTPSTKIDPRIYRSQDYGYDLTIAGGYSFTNNFRADVSLDFLEPIGSSGYKIASLPGGMYQYAYYARLSQYVGLVNGYYDFGTWSIFTPYVGAGVGLGFRDLRAASYKGSTTDEISGNYNDFAWALMAGVGIDVYNHTKVDLGYRYLNTGTLQGTKLYSHQVRAGVRYMLDN